MKYLGCLLVLFLAMPSLGAVSAKKAKPVAKKILSGEGAVFGGIAGSGFSLLDVRLSANKKKKIERVVIDVGDKNGAAMKGLPGFYYAELKKNPQRLVIDFSQMPKAKVKESQLNRIFKASKSVVGTAITSDPVDSSLSLTLDLKKNTKVRVYQVAGKKSTSKVVIDLLAE